MKRMRQWGGGRSFLQEDPLRGDRRRFHAPLCPGQRCCCRWNILSSCGLAPGKIHPAPNILASVRMCSFNVYFSFFCLSQVKEIPLRMYWRGVVYLGSVEVYSHPVNDRGGVELMRMRRSIALFSLSLPFPHSHTLSLTPVGQRVTSCAHLQSQAAFWSRTSPLCCSPYHFPGSRKSCSRFSRTRRFF